MNIKQTAEQFALAQWLSDWPDEWAYQDIIENLESDEYDEVIPWHLIENESGKRIAELIESTRWSFEQTVKKLLDEQHAILFG